jgi:cytochrome c
MKKLLAMLFVAALAYSCGGGDENKNTTDENKPVDTSAAAAAPAEGNAGGVDSEKALTLIGSSDCTTCHAIDKKVIGPAYKDVAKKYPNTPEVVDSLMHKVKKGGMGNWGNIPMTPHPDLPDEDIRTMVTYILSLKNQ